MSRRRAFEPDSHKRRPLAKKKPERGPPLRQVGRSHAAVVFVTPLDHARFTVGVVVVCAQRS